MSQNLPHSSTPAARKLPNIVAFTGGKGGVGKTSVAVNLAIALARHGHKVCLLDGDTGLANVNILLGLQPQYSLEHLIRGERSLEEVMIEGPSGLKIVPSASGVSRCAELDDEDQRRLLVALKTIEQNFDWVLIDTAAGIGTLTTTMVESAQMAAVIITPEPTSLTDAFSLLKLLARRGYQRPPQVIVNMVRGSEQPHSIFRRFKAAMAKYIGLDCTYLGSVWMDESLRQAVSRQTPVATLPVTDPSCRLFMRLADSLASAFRQADYADRAMSDYWLQQLDQRPEAKAKAPPLTQEKAIDLVLSTKLKPERALPLINDLLASLEPDDVDQEKLEQLIQQLKRLNHGEAITPPTAELHPVDPVSPDLQESGAIEPPPTGERAGAYNRQRFGCQEHLLQSLRNLDHTTSLSEFLSLMR